MAHSALAILCGPHPWEAAQQYGKGLAQWLLLPPPFFDVILEWKTISLTLFGRLSPISLIIHTTFSGPNSLWLLMGDLARIYYEWLQMPKILSSHFSMAPFNCCEETIQQANTRKCQSSAQERPKATPNSGVSKLGRLGSLVGIRTGTKEGDNATVDA